MTEKLGWFQRLKQGLTKSSSKLTEGLAAILVKRKLDQKDGPVCSLVCVDFWFEGW